MTIEQYIESINNRYKLGNATEHTFRGDLTQLIEYLVPTITVTNEPKRQKCGAPDYILTKKEIPIGFIEAKDIGDADLSGSKKTGNKEQFDRYKASLNNLIFTDYLDFHLYREGQFVRSIRLAEVTPKGIKIISNNIELFKEFIKDFCTYIGQTINSSKKLAVMLAGKAKLMARIIEQALLSDVESTENSSLKEQMQGFKSILIHDLTPKGFADVYAQTITYGMFAARSHDPSLPTFSRQEAYELIPKSNPFLKKLFGYIAGLDIDDRIKWVVDDLINIFLACNIENLLKDYGKGTQTEDPIIHFYEDFLSEYDPALRKARGVWYTPKPVVNFIVRAVDDILKTEFDMPQGLADTSKIKIKVEQQGAKGKIEKEVHKVQILDPATGTGTFLAEVIRHIHKKFEGQQGIWSNYVEEHLLPRLNGFELLMASYAMAHLKLDLLLTETGFKPTKDQRFKVYLTNSLEEHHPDTGTLFANWLSTEANEANLIKRDTPVMVVMGNPPYSVSSSNKSDWIEKLTTDYKKDLNERNIQPLSDDYIKFIRFGQHFIDKNGSGILAYISNNSFIDGIIHRQMRKSLLESFDKIYIMDLHGSSKKNEICPDGSVDQNVFDIMQGVSINIFIKNGKRKKNDITKVFHYDLFGKREFKYDNLNCTSLDSYQWNNLQLTSPNYFFVKKNFMFSSLYDKGIKLDELFITYNTGIETGRDDFFIDIDSTVLKDRIEKVFLNIDDSKLLNDYKITNTSSFRFKDNLSKSKFDSSKIKKILYRPFDIRFTYYDIDIQRRASYNTIKHLFNTNYAISTCRQQSTFDFQHIIVTNCIIERCTVSLQTKETGYIFPIYIYNDTNGEQTILEKKGRVPNLKPEILNRIAKNIGLTFTNDKEITDSSFAPIDILDYIYAVLHSPKYREKYKEFLKIDFPRVPYPKDKDTFWQLVKLGGEIRQIHLFESPIVEKYITQYPEDGTNTVNKPSYKDEKVYINETQYFSNVPEIAWNFYIGGYQPAQKWLKDRKNRKLEFDDILHYQKIIVALTETDRLMKEIDKIEFMD